MEPNPKSFPVLSYVLGRLPTFGHKPGHTSGSDTIGDIEAPPSDASASPSGQNQIVDHMPRLTDPKLVASMTRAIADVAETRSVLQTIGERPDHEVVDTAKAKLADIEATLSKQLEDLVLSPRPVDVDRLEWREHLADKEKQCREAAEKENQTYKAIIQLDEMHEAYEKLLKDAEERLVKIYESADKGGDAVEDENEDGPVVEEVNEEVVGILQQVSGTELERVDLSGRRLRILPEAFGRIRGSRP